MRTIEKTVYKYEELSEKAKEKARNRFYEYWSYPWSRENEEALEHLTCVFGLDVHDWSYDESSANVSYSLRREFPGHTGIRLYNWIMHNLYWEIYSPKYLKTIAGKARYSKIAMQRACPTGYYISEAMLDPLHRFLKAPNDTDTMESLVGECIDAWCSCVKKDVKYYYSVENMVENFNANEIEFYEDGSQV